MEPAKPPLIGKNIQKLRKARGLTLDVLSERSGVSKAMLSQIEQEKANPTVATVWKIAQGLDAEINSLLGAGGLNIKGSLWCLLGPYIAFALPVSVLILRRAFEAVPQEMIDAGQMDGCTSWQTFWHIALPMVKPALSTVLIFNFLTIWNEYAFALTLLGPGCQTIPLAITEFKGEHDVQITSICAALLLIIVPLLAVYACAQKHIVNGLTAGAVKE